MRSWWSIALLSATLAACSTTSTLPDPGKTDSPIAFAKQLRTATSANLDKVIVAIDRGDSSLHDWGTQYAAWWCPLHEQVSGRAAVFAKFREYCQSHTGVVVEHPQHPTGFFCASQTNQDLVLFTFNTGQNVSTDPRYSQMGCSAGQVTSVLIEEPAGGDSKSDAYRKLLYQEGFRTNDERLAEERAALAAQEAAIKQAAAEAAAQQQREIRQRILPKTPIGSRICHSGEGSRSSHSGYLVLGQPAMTKDAGTIELVGFLEGRSESRIQIRVSGITFRDKAGMLSALSDLQYQGSTITPNTTIWDGVTVWHLCD